MCVKMITEFVEQQHAAIDAKIAKHKVKRYVRLWNSKLFSNLWGVVSLNCVRLIEASLICARKFAVARFEDGERENMGFPCGKVLVDLDNANSPLHPSLVDGFWKIGTPCAVGSTPLARIRKVRLN